MSVEKIPIVNKLKDLQTKNPERLSFIGFGLVIGEVAISNIAPVLGMGSAITGLTLVDLGTRGMNKK